MTILIRRRQLDDEAVYDGSDDLDDWSTRNVAPTLSRLCPSRPSHPSFPSPGTLATTWTVLSTILRVWIARSRQRRALSRLIDDRHLLKDIGVSQEEALHEAEKPFWRR